MGFVSAATAAATIIGGAMAADSANKAAKAQKDIARQQMNEARRAQELLQKRTDEAISDMEAAELRARGLISSGTEELIKSLNASTVDFATGLDELAEQTKTDEQSLLEAIASSGALTQSELESGFLDAIGRSAGFQEEAVASLSPFNEAGKTSLKFLQFKTGQLTPEEEAEFRQEYNIPEGEAPQSAVAKAAEQAAIRRLRASGVSQAGFGVEKLAQTAAAIESDELARLERMAGEGRQAASGIAAIQKERAGDILNLQQRLALTKAELADTQAERERLVSSAAQKTRLGLGEKKIGQELLTAQQIGAAQQARDIDLANLASAEAAKRGNIRIGSGTQIGQLGMAGMEMASKAQQGAIKSQQEADLLPIVAGKELLTLGLDAYKQSQNNDFVGPMQPGL